MTDQLALVSRKVGVQIAGSPNLSQIENGSLL